MIPPEVEVRVYQTPDGHRPFDDWLTRLRDLRAIEKIDARIARAKRYWREHRNANSPLS